VTGPKPPLISANLAWFLFAMILANIASAMTFVVLALYLAEDLGASVAEVGLVFTLASMVPVVLQVFGGWLSDTIGRLRTIAIGSTVAALGYLGLFLASDWRWALAALCLEYVSGSLVGPSFGAFIAEQSTEKTRGRVFGISTGLFQIVGVVGPLAGGFIAGRLGFRALMFAAFLLYSAATLVRIWMALSLRFASASPRQAQLPTLASFKTSFAAMFGLLTAGGLVTWIFVTDGVRDITFRLSGELQSLYLGQVAEITVEGIGILHALMSGVMMLVQFPAGWLSDRFGERKLIALGFVFQGVGLGWFVAAGNFWQFIPVAVFLGLGFGVMMPAYNALVSKAVPDTMRGIAFGMFYSSLGLISLPAPALGALLWTRFGPRVPFVITALGVLAVVPVVWVKFKLSAQPIEARAPVLVESETDI
jgi:MFS family permease